MCGPEAFRVLAYGLRVGLALELIGDLTQQAADQMVRRHWGRVERGFHSKMHPDSTAKEILADDVDDWDEDEDDTELESQLVIYSQIDLGGEG
jgi:hypothetical protein